jgi:bacillithiol biosynthesis cysteine-adding enzyme BshC
MDERPARLLEYGTFRRPGSPLFRDYLEDAPKIRPFFEEGGFSIEALSRAAERTASLPRQREALALCLERQQRERGSLAAAAQAQRLALPNATAVVTGQQPVLFGGPLFVLYKGLGALCLARLLEKRLKTPVVPVFWVASDDHDFAEIRSTTVLDEAGELRTVRYEPLQEPLGKPASQIILDPSIEKLLDSLAGLLPPTLHRDDILARLRRSYRPGASLSQSFASFLSSVLPELVVLDPADPALKTLMAPVLAREIEEGSPTSRLAAEVGERLLEGGYHQQVPVRQGLLNLFVTMDGERRAVGFADSEIEVRGLGRTLTKADALMRLKADPAPWSPGVLLRPLAEDFMLPTLAYLGGPAEIAYHAQIGTSYSHFGIPRPAIVPRPSLTLVEPAQWRALDAEGLDNLDLDGEVEALLNRRAREAHPGVETAFETLRKPVEEGMARVASALSEVDPTLEGASEATLGRILHQIDTLHEKATRALKKRDVSRSDRLRRTRDALFPGGALQERGLGLVSVLARHGVAVTDALLERLDPLARGHQVISL